MNYVPIEELLPDWEYGRAVVTALIPPKLTFVRGDNALNLDLRFIQQIQDVAVCTNFYQIQEMADRITLLRSEVPKSLPGPEAWDWIRGSRADDQLVNRCTTMLESHAVMREAMGFPSTLQLVRHYFGIKRWTPSVPQRYKHR